MKKLFIALACALSLAACSQAPKTTVCENPLTYTDIPDNDVIRVGNDYYMVSTTMYFCPGAPIMHSTDLVHWELVNYVFDVIVDNDAINLRNGQTAYGRGQWATSLQYNNGTYYILFISNDQPGQTFVYTTKDIENGSWERHVLDRQFHDCSLLFDGDRTFAIYGNGQIHLTELTQDAFAVKEGGLDQVIITTPEGFNLRDEGARAYKIGDWYYVLTINWPTGGVRTETAWRAKEITGPYERKDILQGKFDGRNDGVAQGPIFETQNGDWYAMMFQDHGGVGRIPTLQPVTWVDEWPILGDNTVPVKTFEVNLPEGGQNYTWASDEFDSSELALVWQWNHKPLNDCWNVADGKLNLTTGHIAEGIVTARNSLTQRTVGPRCWSETMVDVSALKPGDAAGICAFQSSYGRIGVDVDAEGNKFLVAVHRKAGRKPLVENADPRDRSQWMMVNGRADGGEEELLRMPFDQDKVWLKVRYVFTAVEEGETSDEAFLSYSLDGQNWTELEQPLKMSFALDFFTGYRSALYCYATIETGGKASFDYFHQEAY